MTGVHFSRELTFTHFFQCELNTHVRRILLIQSVHVRSDISVLSLSLQTSDIVQHLFYLVLYKLSHFLLLKTQIETLQHVQFICHFLKIIKTFSLLQAKIEKIKLKVKNNVFSGKEKLRVRLLQKASTHVIFMRRFIKKFSYL